MGTSVGEIQLDLSVNLKNITKDINDFSRDVSKKFASSFGLDKILKNAFSSGTSKDKDLKNKISQTEEEIKKLKAEMSKLSSTKVSTKEMDRLRELINKTKKETKNLTTKMEEVANTRVKTDDYAELCNYYDGLNKKLNTLLNKQEKFENTNVSKNSKQWKNLQYDIDEVRKSILYAKGEIKDINLSGTAFKSGAQTEEYKTIANQIDANNKKLDVYKIKLQEANNIASAKKDSDLSKKSTQLKKLCDRLDVYKIKLQEAQNKEKTFKNANANSCKSLKLFGNTAKKTTKSTNGLFNSLKFFGKMFTMTLMFKAISYALSGMKEGFDNLVQYSANANKNASAMATSMLQLKNALASAFQPIMTAIVPHLQVFINYLIQGIDTVGKFFAVLLNGASTYTRAKQAQVDYAKTLKNTSKAAKKAAKDNMKSIMSFDKLNVLNSSKKDDDNSNDDSGMPSTKTMFEEVPIESNITKAANKLREVLERLNKALQPTTQALGRLKTALKPLGNFTYQALTDFYNHFLKPVGEWTLGTGLPRFIDAISNGLNEINWEKINGALVKLWDALAPFSITIGEGLLWLWENVLVPISTWTANNILPLFLESLAAVIEILNGTIDALKPLGKWMFENFLKPLAVWTGGIIVTVLEGIVSSLEHFSDWVSNNKSLIQGIAIDVAVFFAAWKTTELRSFIQQSGGCVSALKNIAKALVGTRIAKVKDKLETMYLTGLYAKDFVLGLASSIKQLAIQGVQFAKVTALKVADKIATIGMTVATTAWNAVCTIATVITTAFGAAVAFLTSPIGLVVLAIGALIAIGVLLYKNWDKISTFAKKAFEKIRENVSKAFHGIKKIFSGIGKWFCARFTDVTNAFKNAPSWFKNKFTNVVSVIKQKFSPVTKFFSGIWNGIKNTTSKVWDTITGMFGKGKKIFSGFKDGVLSVFKGIVGTLIKGINKVIKMPFDKINGLLNKIRNTKILKVKPFAKLWKENPIPTPQIPKLAQGGYVKANTPQLAMIGDNRHQGEIVAPEDKLYKVTSSAVINALKPFISAISNSGTGNTPDKLYLTINLGNSKIAKEVALSISRENRRVGKAVYNLT